MKQRKEVHLTDEIIALLQAKADAEGRSLKNFMEQLLISAAGKRKTNST